jgi:lipoic acid synthetase
MLGLGESLADVKQSISDLREQGVDILTIGQYLRPSGWHHPVMRYASPEEFAELGAFARSLGFSHVESGPLVRSSYHAEKGVTS